MGKDGDRFRFVFESAAKILVGKEFIFQYLNGNDPVVNIIERLIDNGHSADADNLHDFVSSVQSFSDIIFHITVSSRQQTGCKII